MTDYVTMQTRIADELVNEPITTAQIQKAIQSAIKHYERRPFWFNEYVNTFSTVASQEYYSSTDLADIATLVSIKAAAVTDGGYKLPIKAVDFDVIEDGQDGTVTGTPTMYAYWQSQIRLYPIPEGVQTVTLAYIRKLTALSADGDTNAWMTDGEELIRQSAKRILALDILHADDLGARCVTREREAYDELLAENRRRRPNTLLNMPAFPNEGSSFDINRG